MGANLVRFPIELMNVIRKLFILLPLFLLVACTDSNSPTAVIPPEAEFQIKIRTLDKFDQETQVFVQGEKITIELSITNLTDAEKLLRMGTGQIFDFQLINKSSEIVWDWSFHRVFTQAFHDIIVPGNETETRTEFWDQIVNDGNMPAIGDYTLEGWFVGAREEIATIDISII